jgi:hypothetical protein
MQPGFCARAVSTPLPGTCHMKNLTGGVRNTRMKKKAPTYIYISCLFFIRKYRIWLRRPTKEEEWEERSIHQAHSPRSCVVNPQKKLYKLQFFLEGREIQDPRKICAGAAF